jgi:hypothetical protein
MSRKEERNKYGVPEKSEAQSIADARRRDIEKGRDPFTGELLDPVTLEIDLGDCPAGAGNREHFGDVELQVGGIFETWGKPGKVRRVWISKTRKRLCVISYDEGRERASNEIMLSGLQDGAKIQGRYNRLLRRYSLRVVR